MTIIRFIRLTLIIFWIICQASKGQPANEAFGYAGAMNKIGSWFMQPDNQLFPYVCKANPFHRKEEEFHDYRGDLMPCRKAMKNIVFKAIPLHIDYR